MTKEESKEAWTLIKVGLALSSLSLLLLSAACIFWLITRQQLSPLFLLVVVLFFCGTNVLSMLYLRRDHGHRPEQGTPDHEDNQRLEADVLQLMEIVSSATEGDLTARGNVTHARLGSVTDALNHMLESIGKLVLEVRRSGLDVTSCAERILASSETMSMGAAQQAAALNRVTKKIRALGSRSLEITQIVEMIDEISTQTNTLALNAAIEASRAGEQGKGFAVVAHEVRLLAERISKATKEVGDFIDSIQEATEESITAMEEIRLVTRSTADGAIDTTRAAEEMTADAEQFGRAIARFKVHRVDRKELASALEARHLELRLGMETLLDLVEEAEATSPAARNAARHILKDLEEMASRSQQRTDSPEEAPAPHKESPGVESPQ